LALASKGHPQYLHVEVTKAIVVQIFVVESLGASCSTSHGLSAMFSSPFKSAETLQEIGQQARNFLSTSEENLSLQCEAS